MILLKCFVNLTFDPQIVPRLHAYEIVHFTKTDARLANNGIPDEVQKLRCRANYHALRFAPPIEALAKKIVRILREKGPFLVLHLRYEMDMVAFSGCNEGCNEEEIDELTKMRYASCLEVQVTIQFIKGILNSFILIFFLLFFFFWVFFVVCCEDMLIHGGKRRR